MQNLYFKLLSKILKKNPKTSDKFVESQTLNKRITFNHKLFLWICMFQRLKKFIQLFIYNIIYFLFDTLHNISIFNFLNNRIYWHNSNTVQTWTIQLLVNCNVVVTSFGNVMLFLAWILFHLSQRRYSPHMVNLSNRQNETKHQRNSTYPELNHSRPPLSTTSGRHINFYPSLKYIITLNTHKPRTQTNRKQKATNKQYWRHK